MSAFGFLTKGFGGAVAALGLVTSPVLATDAPEAPPCGVVEAEGYEHVRACATPGYETPRTLDDIQADRSLSRMVILHFGPGHLDSDLVATDLSGNVGIPTVAIPGGPDHGVQVIIAGFTSDGLIFDQSEQNRGRVGAIAQRGYPRRMEAIRTAEAASSASLIRTSATSPSGFE